MHLLFDATNFVTNVSVTCFQILEVQISTPNIQYHADTLCMCLAQFSTSNNCHAQLQNFQIVTTCMCTCSWPILKSAKHILQPGRSFSKELTGFKTGWMLQTTYYSSSTRIRQTSYIVQHYSHWTPLLAWSSTFYVYSPITAI